MDRADSLSLFFVVVVVRICLYFDGMKWNIDSPLDMVLSFIRNVCVAVSVCRWVCVVSRKTSLFVSIS